MSLDIALVDARTNCARDGAKCTVTLRSGVSITGYLEKVSIGLGTVHLQTDGGGWTTIDRDEIVAVASHR